VVAGDAHDPGSLVTHVLTTLRAVHVRSGLAAPRTPPIRVEYRGRRVLPLASLRLFLAALPPGSVERIAALLILLLAARESEVLRLRIGDVDLEAGTVTLRRVKGWQATGGTSAVVVRAPAALLAELRGWIAGLRPGLAVAAPLLSADKGRRWAPLRPHSLSGRLVKASAAAGSRRRSSRSAGCGIKRPRSSGSSRPTRGRSSGCSAQHADDDRAVRPEPAGRGAGGGARAAGGGGHGTIFGP